MGWVMTDRRERAPYPAVRNEICQESRPFKWGVMSSSGQENRPSASLSVAILGFALSKTAVSGGLEPINIRHGKKTCALMMVLRAWTADLQALLLHPQACIYLTRHYLRSRGRNMKRKTTENKIIYYL